MTFTKRLSLGLAALLFMKGWFYMNYNKYKKAYYKVPIKNRRWPENEIKKAPIWCSVDLRDGNQALINPMTMEEKLDFFKFLVNIGFKEIEVAFPAASDTEFQFVRKLIEDDLIPDDVTIQVLTQSRAHIIDKTVEAITGAKNSVVHLYNSTSELQRRVVFGKSKKEIVQLAIEGAKRIREICEKIDGNVRYEYSPETFVGTEMEYAAEICNSVLDVFKPTPEKKVIINLPSTIEMSTANIYADQIEYMSGALEKRENVILSVHAHNDWGAGVAATELALLAGADRVEGTLFGNGERTGNADILVLALNLYSQGIDPELDFSNVEEIIEKYEKVTQLSVHPRHPYAGELVYTAFSGSHQDAIKKGMDYYARNKSEHWENPYLPIDPHDLGRKYEPVRINSQSGKGGVAFILQRKFGINLPKKLLIEFSSIVNDISDTNKQEITPEFIRKIFIDKYVNVDNHLKLIDYKISAEDGNTHASVNIMLDGKKANFIGIGNGPLDAVINIIRNNFVKKIEIMDFNEHALENSSKSEAIAYIAIKNNGGNDYWGVGIDTNISTASIKALISATNIYLDSKKG